jgi:hypothetical protein
MKPYILIIIFIISFSTHAKDFNNGCGTSWHNKYVPEKIAILGINFTKSCAKHDNCYSKCKEEGESHGQAHCTSSTIAQTNARRKICDDNFDADMKKSCDDSKGLQKGLCRGVASIYTIAVRIAGGGSFEGLEIPQEFYEYLKSEEANRFDFDEFTNDIIKIQSLNKISSNNTLKLSIENKQPIAEFINFKKTDIQRITMKNDTFQIKKIKYGNIDLSRASNGNQQINIADLENAKLDLKKLKIESSFIKK